MTTRTTRTTAFWNTPRRPMITHTSVKHQIPSQKKTKWKLYSLKNCPKLIILNLQETLQAKHRLKLPNKMCKYEINPSRTLGATEQTRDAGWTDILEKTHMYCNENRWRLFCLLRIIQESGVYQLGVPQGQGDSSAPSTTDPMICGFCLVTTPNTRGETVERSIVTRTDRQTNGRMDGVKPIYPPTTLLCGGYKNAFPLLMPMHIIIPYRCSDIYWNKILWQWWLYRIKYGLPYCVTCPSMSTDPGSLKLCTRYSGVPVS